MSSPHGDGDPDRLIDRVVLRIVAAQGSGIRVCSRSALGLVAASQWPLCGVTDISGLGAAAGRQRISVASTRSTFTIDRALAERARRLGIDVSAAAREGVELFWAGSLADGTPEGGGASQARAEKAPRSRARYSSP
jgi:hypothetical protein